MTRGFANYALDGPGLSGPNISEHVAQLRGRRLSPGLSSLVFHKRVHKRDLGIIALDRTCGARGSDHEFALFCFGQDGRAACHAVAGHLIPGRASQSVTLLHNTQQI